MFRYLQRFSELPMHPPLTHKYHHLTVEPQIETVGDAYIAGMAEQPLTARHSVV